MAVRRTTWRRQCVTPYFGRAEWIKYIPTLEIFSHKVGPVRMSGSPTTVKQTRQRIGPSMRFVADLSNWDQSLMNHHLGPVGSGYSRLNYSDQWDGVLHRPQPPGAI